MFNDTQRLLALALTVGLVGCNKGGNGDDTDTDGGETDDVTTCTSGIKGTTVPAAGADDVYFRSTFVIEFLADEHTFATFTLVDGASAAVALDAPTWSEDGKAVFFKSTEPLDASTAYTLTAEYGGAECEKVAPIAFTTSSTGSEVADSDFTGNSYALELGSLTIIRPAGVNGLLGQLLGGLEDAIVIVPQSYNAEASEITFFGGLADPTTGEQDQCQATIEFPIAASYDENPYFEINAPDGLPLTVSGVTIDLLNLSLSGAFAPGATDIVGVEMNAAIDTRSLGDLLSDAGLGDGSVCDLLGDFTGGAVSCETCPAGVEPPGDFCLSIQAVNGTATGETWELSEITQEEVDDNEACAEE